MDGNFHLCDFGPHPNRPPSVTPTDGSTSSGRGSSTPEAPSEVMSTSYLRQVAFFKIAMNNLSKGEIFISGIQLSTFFTFELFLAVRDSNMMIRFDIRGKKPKKFKKINQACHDCKLTSSHFIIWISNDWTDISVMTTTSSKDQEHKQGRTVTVYYIKLIFDSSPFFISMTFEGSPLDYQETDHFFLFLRGRVIFCRQLVCK